MKRLYFLLLTLLTTVLLTAQTKEENKSGWNLGVLPSVMFDSDVGFQYGAILNLFNYGDGSLYPQYRYMVYAEWSRQTRGGAINQLLFDAPNLLPHDLRLTADLSYLTEKALDFYGFNGREAVYQPELEDPDHPYYISRMYYRHQRRMTRLQADLQGKLQEHWRWIGGVGWFDTRLGTVDISRLNKGKDADDLLPDTALLYDQYVQWGVLPADQAEGGSHLMFKAGLIYDTRDNEPNPMRGVWTEAVLLASPALGNSHNLSFVRYTLIHRQYVTLKKEVLSLACRLGVQGTLAGEYPFYLFSYMQSSFDKATNRDGLGGARTLRGVLRNRVVGDGMAYGNAELRWKFLRTTVWKQNIYLALNLFTDAGMVVDPLDVSMSAMPAALKWEQQTDRPHLSSGMGLRIAMNQNFIVAVDYGRAWSKRDGESGLYINLGYLF